MPLASARMRLNASTRVCTSVVVSASVPVMAVLASALWMAARLALSTPVTPAWANVVVLGAVPPLFWA